MSIPAETLPPRARFLARVFNAEAGEFPALMLSFAFFFCVLCAYYIVRPIRDESGVLLGREFIGYAFTATFAVMLAAVPAIGWIVGHLQRRLIVPVVYGVVIAVLLVFWALLGLEKSNTFVAGAFFVWVNVFSLFVVSLFWSFMTEVWRSDQAKRIYGFVSVGGTFGALTGPLLIQAFIRAIGVANLLLMAAGFLALSLVFYTLLRRLVGDNGRTEPPSAPDRASIFAGAINVWKSPYLFRIALWTLAGNMFGIYFYLEQEGIIGAAIGDQAERLVLLSRIENAVSLLTMTFELFITGRLLQFIGVGRTMMLGPLFILAALAALTVSPTLAVIATIMVIERAMDYGMMQPSLRVLYTIVASADKYRAQNFNDTVIYRGGGAATTWLYNGLVGALGLAGPALAIVAMPFAAAWVWLAIDLGARHDKGAGERDAFTAR